jgi:hypothetical protein
MLDRVRLVQDLRGDPFILPESIPYMQDALSIAVRASGHVTYSFNVPRLENRINDRILSVSRDVAILRGIIDDVCKLDPRLKTPMDQWSVQLWELAENRKVKDPEQFAKAVAEAALETKDASVKNFEGLLRTLIGPKRRRTRIYAKQVEDEYLIRHEIVCERPQIDADFKGRRVEDAISFLESPIPQSRLDESWEKYAARFEGYNPMEVFEALRKHQSPKNAACSLDYYFLARSLMGGYSAMRAIGLSISTVDRYNREIRRVQESLTLSQCD